MSENPDCYDCAHQIGPCDRCLEIEALAKKAAREITRKVRRSLLRKPTRPAAK